MLLRRVRSKALQHGNSDLKRQCLQYDLHLLDAKVRHLGTDRNVKILGQIYDYISKKIDIKLRTAADTVEKRTDASLLQT